MEVVLSALGVSEEPSDYVVIVDTSASMKLQGRYDRVRAGLRRMVSALGSQDRVAVVTFDSLPRVRRPLRALGGTRSDVLAALPGAPTGARTDIGAALDTALDVMGAGELRRRSAVLLFTDGRIDAAPSSAYADAGTAGWDELRTRAAALQRSHDVAPLAVALASETDAAALGKVFSHVVDVPSTDLGNYLADVSSDVMRASAVRQVQGHLADPVTVTVSGFPARQGGSAGAAVSIAVTNTNPVVPVRVSQLAITGPDQRATSVGLPEVIELAPGATTEVTASVPALRLAGDYGIAGVVSSPWESVITKDLGLAWTPQLALAAPLLVAPGSIGADVPNVPTSPWLLWVGLGLGLVVVGAFVVRSALRRRPRLTGSLTIERDGAVVDEQVLRGRRMVVGGEGAPSLSVSPARAADGRRGVLVQADPGGGSAVQAQLSDGDEVAVGDTVVRYLSTRTRTLHLIETPPAPADTRPIGAGGVG